MLNLNPRRTEYFLVSGKNVFLKNLEVHVFPLDVTKSESIEKAVNEIILREGRIDLLVNNAGAGFAKTTEHATEEELEWITSVNYHGLVRCCKAVIPYMRKQKSGQIINVTSVGGLVGQPFNEFYCGAKFAVEGYTESLASYLSDAFNISFSLVEPGGISTEFMESAVKATVDNGQLTLPEYQGIMDRYLASAQSRSRDGADQVYQSGEEVARIILELAQSNHPPLRIRSSDWAEDLCRLKTSADPDGTKLLARLKEMFL